MMKTIRLIALYLWCLAYMALGGTVVIGWDAQPNTSGFRVWKGIQLVKTVTGTKATVTLHDSGIQTLGVSAYNASGESAVTEIKLVPVVVQSSNELRIWQRLTTLYVEQSSAMFFRLTPPSVSP